jgi:N-glycosylase/DNA lyase
VTSINSGQVFLWEEIGSIWYGIYGNHVLRLSQAEDGPELSSFPELEKSEQRVFRLDDDLSSIFAEITRDPLVRRLVSRYPGLRLLRQQPEQCIFSFVCANNTNISMIRRMLRNLTRKFGKAIKVDGIDFFTFPAAQDLDSASIDELRSCGVGYRAKAIKAVARSIVNADLDLDMLKRSSYFKAKEELLRIYGIGDKIADCVLLFSLDKLEAFPLDIWISRAVAKYYSWAYDPRFSDKLTHSQYQVVSEGMRNYFGRYAGYAQQYLYYYMRHKAGMKW